MTEVATAGIELCFEPPLKDERRISNNSVAFQRTLFSAFEALALPALISMPECPPLRPSTEML